MDIFTKPNFTVEELDFIMTDALEFNLAFADADNAYIEYVKEDIYFCFCQLDTNYWEMEFEFSAYSLQTNREIKIRSAEYKNITIGDIFETLKFADGWGNCE